MKLSDTQLMILSSASQRTDHAAVLPANLKGSAANKVVNKLLNEKLLQELRAKDDMPVWRRGDDNRPFSLRITKAGLKAIEVEDVAEASDNIAAADPDEAAAADVSTEAKSSERPSRARRSDAKKTAAVSAKAVKASSDRLSATMIDELLRVKLQSFLTDKIQISLLLRETRCRPAEIGSGLMIASGLADSLTSGSPMAQGVADLLARVTGSHTSLKISIKRDRLLATLRDKFVEQS